MTVRPVILTVALLILTLFAVLSIFQVPVQMTPDLNARVISIRTAWPGTTPQDVEKEILVEQKRYLGRLSGLERMFAKSTTGTAEIEFVQFLHVLPPDASGWLLHRRRYSAPAWLGGGIHADAEGTRTGVSSVGLRGDASRQI